MRVFFSSCIGIILSGFAAAAYPVYAIEPDKTVLVGSYRLVSSTRTIVETGQVENSFGANPTGFIMYGADHRMMVLIVRGERPAPSFATITPADKAGLFDTMAAYGGTYTFDGRTVTHHIDVSYNAILTGSDVIRKVAIDGDRLIYTTDPQPAPTDGKISTSELIWERVRPAPTAAH